MMQVIDFTVELKNLSFTQWLSGHFLNLCGINSLRQIASWSYGFRFILKILLIFSITSSTLLAQNPNSDINEVRQVELLHLLKQDCGSCHGLTLKGGLGPALLPQNLTGKSVPFLTSTILDGRPGTAMPAWRGVLKPVEALWIAGELVRGVQP